MKALRVDHLPCRKSPRQADRWLTLNITDLHLMYHISCVYLIRDAHDLYIFCFFYQMCAGFKCYWYSYEPWLSLLCLLLLHLVVSLTFYLICINQSWEWCKTEIKINTTTIVDTSMTYLNDINLYVKWCVSASYQPLLLLVCFSYALTYTHIWFRQHTSTTNILTNAHKFSIYINL